VVLLNDFDVDEVALAQLSEHYSPNRIKRSGFVCFNTFGGALVSSGLARSVPV